MTSQIVPLQDTIHVWPGEGTSTEEVPVNATPPFSQETFWVVGTPIALSEGAKYPTYASTINEMQSQIEELQRRVAELEESIDSLISERSDQEVIVLRTITRAQAKKEIIGLFQTGETLYYSDIAERLRIDLPLVLEICQELKEAGEIEVDADVI